MVVLHIAEIVGGGVERYIQWLLPLLSQHGIRQHLLCSPTFDVSPLPPDVEVHKLDFKRSFNPFRLLGSVRSVRKVVRAVDPDIVYCHSSFGGLYGRLACLGLGKKVVYNPHGWGFKMKGIKRHLFAFIEWLLSPLTTRFICISHDEQDSAIRRHICSPVNSVLIENGIDVSAVASAQPLRSLLPPFAPAGHVIGMVGRLGEQKNPECFVRMASIVAKKFPNTLFVIIGDGVSRKSVEAMAMDLGVNLFISGWVQPSQAYGILKCFDVAVLLSRWEGFSLAVLEYMAASRSFVASNVSGISDSVDDGVNGLLVPSDGHEQAADAVIRLLEDPALAASLKKNAFEKVSAKYTLQRVACETIELFNELVLEK